MRTTPIVLGHLDDPHALARLARTCSHMTHGDPEAADARVLWNLAQRHAILHGEFALVAGVEHMPSTRRARWRTRIAQAEDSPPHIFPNGAAVGALQCAWSAIVTTDADGPEHLEAALRQAVAAGQDTDTAAAIAGGCWARARGSLRSPCAGAAGSSLARLPGSGSGPGGPATCTVSRPVPVRRRFAALYAARRTGEVPWHALSQIATVLPQADPNPAFRQLL